MAQLALPLIALVWVPLWAAHPLFQDAPPHVVSLSGVSYWDETATTTIPCSSTQVSDDLVYQIADGQVQVAVNAAADAHIDSCPASSSTSRHSARALSTAIPVQALTVSSSITVTQTITTSSQAASSFVTTVPESILTQLSVSAIQSVSGTAVGNTAGFVVTALDTSQHVESVLGLSLVASATGSLSVATTATLTAVQSSVTYAVSDLSVDNIFQKISTDPPPAQINRVAQHPVQASQHIASSQQQRIGTNKFYTNFFLGDQNSTVFLFPYSVAWSRGNGLNSSWGLSVSHTESDQFVHSSPKYTAAGLRTDAGDWAYYINPLGIQSIILSANELTTTADGKYPGLTVSDIGFSSVEVDLYAPGWTTPTVQYPLVQGASFITANYSYATPLIQTGVGFKNYTYCGAV